MRGGRHKRWYEVAEELHRAFVEGDGKGDGNAVRIHYVTIHGFKVPLYVVPEEETRGLGDLSGYSMVFPNQGADKKNIRLYAPWPDWMMNVFYKNYRLLDKLEEQLQQSETNGIGGNLNIPPPQEIEYDYDSVKYSASFYGDRYKRAWDVIAVSIDNRYDIPSFFEALADDAGERWYCRYHRVGDYLIGAKIRITDKEYEQLQKYYMHESDIDARHDRARLMRGLREIALKAEEGAAIHLGINHLLNRKNRRTRKRN